MFPFSSSSSTWFHRILASYCSANGLNECPLLSYNDVYCIYCTTFKGPNVYRFSLLIVLHPSHRKSEILLYQWKWLNKIQEQIEWSEWIHNETRYIHEICVYFLFRRGMIESRTCNKKQGLVWKAAEPQKTKNEYKNARRTKRLVCTMWEFQFGIENEPDSRHVTFTFLVNIRHNTPDMYKASSTNIPSAWIFTSPFTQE